MTGRRLFVAERGFSLIELMVAVVIAMLASLAISQTFAVFEGQKRTTVSGADAQDNALMALHAIERELRMSGMGTAALSCDQINAYHADRVPQQYVISTLPAAIEQDTPAAGSDQGPVSWNDARARMSWEEAATSASYVPSSATQAAVVSSNQASERMVSESVTVLV